MSVAGLLLIQQARENERERARGEAGVGAICSECPPGISKTFHYLICFFRTNSRLHVCMEYLLVFIKKCMWVNQTCWVVPKADLPHAQRLHENSKVLRQARLSPEVVEDNYRF